jgi:hypothetical protein
MGECESKPSKGSIGESVEKKCSRCGAAFLCRQAEGCWCGGVRVDAAMLAEIRERYADCLCEECLRALAHSADARSF